MDAANKWLKKKRVETRKRGDMVRVCALPIYTGMEPEELEEMNREFLLPRVFEETKEDGTPAFRLFDCQTEGLYAIRMLQGALCAIGVGWGKTLTALKGLCDLWKYHGHRKLMMVVPPDVYPQLVRTDVDWIRSKVDLWDVPLHYMGGLAPARRKGLYESGMEGIYLTTYSALSNRDGEDLLYSIAPTAMAFDECHEISRTRAARTRRVMLYVKQHQPKIIALSGTATKKSLMDYHHLMVAALGDKSPVPLLHTRAMDWAAVIDAKASPTLAEAEVLRPLLLWASKLHNGPKIEPGIASYRRCFKHRRNTAPGVVTTPDTEIGCSLVIDIQAADTGRPGWKELSGFVLQLDKELRTPNGDELEHAMCAWKYHYELTAGFYNELIWPTIEKLIERTGYDKAECHRLLAQSRAWHQAHNEYHKELREWLKYNACRGLDTQLLVSSNMARVGAKDVGGALFEKWRSMHDRDFEGRIERDTKTVRVCDYKIKAAMDWAESTEHGIIWYYNKEIGLWLRDEAKKRGIAHVFCPSGTTGIFKSKGKIAIATWRGHGKGKNLQHAHRNNYFMQPARMADWMQQTIGRTHRNGQEADSLTVRLNLTTEFDHMNYAACLIDALYVQQSDGERQKIIMAVYTNTPKIFPTEVLRERGFTDISILSPDQQGDLAARFGTAGI